MIPTEDIRARLSTLAGRDVERRERFSRLCSLLEHYQDVEPGLVDTDGGDGTGLLTGGPWNHGSYQRLEKLQKVMRRQMPGWHWHLAEVYFRAGRRRVAQCGRCDRIVPPWDEGKLCNHGRRAPTRDSFEARTIRVISDGVDPAQVVFAVSWLEKLWPGGIDLPAELVPTSKRKREGVVA